MGEEITMEKMYQLLLLIKAQPYAYFGKTISLDFLHMFLCGFQDAYEIHCRRFHQPPPHWFLNGFQPYIQAVYRTKRTCGWYIILREQCFSDEESFRLFYRHLDEYVRQGNFGKESSDGNALPGITDLWGLLEEIKKLPQIFLGRISVTLLYQTVQGYKTFQEQIGNREPDGLVGFDSYLASKYGVPMAMWNELLLQKYSEEEQAFNAFYEELALFRQKKVQKRG